MPGVADDQSEMSFQHGIDWPPVDAGTFHADMRPPPPATVTLQVRSRHCHACSPFPRATKNGTSTQRGPDCLSGSRATAELSASTRSPVARLRQNGPRRHHFHP